MKPHIDPVDVKEMTEYLIDTNARIVVTNTLNGERLNQVELRVTVQDDLDKRFGVAKLLADKKGVAAIIEACIYEQVADMLDERRAGLAELIGKTIDRRVESILKTTTTALEHEIAHAVRKHLESRAKAAVDATPLRITLHAEHALLAAEPAKDPPAPVA